MPHHETSTSACATANFQHVAAFEFCRLEHVSVKLYEKAEGLLSRVQLQRICLRIKFGKPQVHEYRLELEQVVNRFIQQLRPQSLARTGRLEDVTRLGQL